MAYYNFLLVLFLLNAANRLFWGVPCNSGFIWRLFQYLFKVLDTIDSLLLKLLNKEFYFYYFFSFFLSKPFWSVLSYLSIWAFEMFSVYPISMNFYFSIAQCFFFLYLVSVEQMVFILNAWLHGMFFLRGFG